MKLADLNQELAVGERLASGPVTRVLLLIDGQCFEVENVIPIGDNLLIEAGAEVEKPIEPEEIADHESAAIDAAYESMQDAEPDHLRIAEDQPEQPS